jgi:hypothetical protein
MKSARFVENLRVLLALKEIDAVYRGDPRRLTPTESHLMGPGHQLLSTANGDLDCIGAVDDGKRYEAHARRPRRRVHPPFLHREQCPRRPQIRTNQPRLQ